MSEVRLRGVAWDHPRGLGGLRAVAARYAAVRPGVTVEWTARSLKAFADEPLDVLARHFDLLYVDHPAIGHAVATDSLVALDAQLPPESLEEAAWSVGRSAESYVWERHRWALPTDAAAQVAAYRPDLLERAGLAVPRTWPDVVGATEALAGVGCRIALPTIPVDAICAFFAVCVALGEEPFTCPDQVVSRPTGREALDVVADVISRAHPASLEWNPPAMLEHMSREDDVAYCPLAFGYSNYARPGFRPALVRAAPPPAGHDGVARGTLGGAGLAVSSHAVAVEEALRFAAHVADPLVQRGAYFDGGGQPGHRSAWMDPGVDAAASGFFGDTVAALDAAYLRPRYDGFLAVQDAAGAGVHAFLREIVGGGHADPDATLEGLDAAARRDPRPEPA